MDEPLKAAIERLKLIEEHGQGLVTPAMATRLLQYIADRELSFDELKETARQIIERIAEAGK